jgi:stage V sporulation protein SpoVS
VSTLRLRSPGTPMSAALALGTAVREASKSVAVRRRFIASYGVDALERFVAVFVCEMMRVFTP